MKSPVAGGAEKETSALAAVAGSKGKIVMMMMRSEVRREYKKRAVDACMTVTCQELKCSHVYISF